MTRHPFVASVALAFTMALAPLAPAAAQNAEDMTAEEIAEAFKKQKTRGLVLVPAGETTAAPTTTETTETATVAAAPAAPAEPVATTVAATEYNEVDKADQVNIKIKFDFDSAALREDQKPQLATLCQVMKVVDVQLFQIVGHTDSSGSAAYNEKLSLLRAQEVKRHLVSDCGIAETRLEAIGMGEAAPFDASDPRSDANRRVEFQALG